MRSQESIGTRLALKVRLPDMAEACPEPTESVGLAPRRKAEAVTADRGGNQLRLHVPG